MYEKGLLGMCSPEALLNKLWLNNTLHFGLRGCKEHRYLCWGDVKLHKTANGVEYLKFNERQTKTRTGSDYSNVRAVPPKMFATDETERDRPANSLGSAASLTIFCHFSRSQDKAPNLTFFWENLSEMK